MGDDADLYPTGEEVGVEAGGGLTLSVLPGSAPPLYLRPQVIWQTGAGGGVQSEPRGAGLETEGTDTGAGGTVPHFPTTLQAAPPLLLIATLTATGLSAPGVSLHLGLTLLLQVLGTPALALHLVLHLQAGALLLALPPTHWALGHHHRHRPHLRGSGHAGPGAVTASAAAPHHHVARAELLDICVVRPGHCNHLQTKRINRGGWWFWTRTRLIFFPSTRAVEKYVFERKRDKV